MCGETFDPGVAVGMPAARAPVEPAVVHDDDVPEKAKGLQIINTQASVSAEILVLSSLTFGSA